MMDWPNAYSRVVGELAGIRFEFCLSTPVSDLRVACVPVVKIAESAVRGWGENWLRGVPVRREYDLAPSLIFP
jgi:hypothetical protein